MADGRVAGRTEGRQLGLERGFQKFVESGRLQGRAIVWANRLGRRGVSSSSSPPQVAVVRGEDVGLEAGGGDGDVPPLGKGDGNGSGNGNGEERLGGVGGEWDGVVLELPPLPHKDGRLRKHITTLYALAETESLSTENNDDAVSDFDDRLRRAQGRAKVIERMVGEGGEKKGSDGNGHDPGAGSGKGQGMDI
jgi:hypothetical protein